MAEQATRRAWWSYPRFSVRGLVCLILLIGAVLGWLVRHARIQRDAVATIRRASGSVMYDWQWKNGELNANGKLGWPKWLVDSIGIDYFGHVTRVELAEHGCDADLVQVARLGQLESLNLARSLVTDVGIAHLSELSSLESLDLSQTKIADAGLAHLKGLVSLKRLSLDDTTIGDPGLVHLRHIASLKRLNLDRTQVSDAGMESLNGLTALFTLSLAGTRVGNSGVEHLKGLAGLGNLRLPGSQIDDAALASLKGMTSLGMLDLDHTAVSDAALPHLKRLSRLKWLYLTGTRISHDGIQELEQTLPNIRVVRGHFDSIFPDPAPASHGLPAEIKIRLLLGLCRSVEFERVNVAAFAELDWSRFDVNAIVGSGAGIATIDERRHSACCDWLLRHGYTIDSLDCRLGLAEVVPAPRRILGWQTQFGYSLGPGDRNLDALRDGFEFDIPEGGGRVLEMVQADLAWQEDPKWFLGLLSIAQEHSLRQLAPRTPVLRPAHDSGQFAARRRRHRADSDSLSILEPLPRG